MILLEDLVLLPTLVLEPFKFGNDQRPRPYASCLEMPEECHRFWLDSLADSGITGLTPLRPASWHVPTRDLTDSETLRKILDAILGDRGGIEDFHDPDSKLVLDGGLALISGGEHLVLSEPHESSEPVGRWLVKLDELGRAVVAAEVDLRGFAGRLEAALRGLGVRERVEEIARRLAGLAA